MVYEILHMELAGMSFQGPRYPSCSSKQPRQLAVRCFSRLASRRIEISSWQRMTVDGSEIRRLPVDVEKIPFCKMASYTTAGPGFLPSNWISGLPSWESGVLGGGVVLVVKP